jgi:hypothetical protein
VPERVEKELGNGSVGPKMDWTPYADGTTWRFVEGVDFQGPLNDFRNRAYTAAIRRRMRAHTEIEVDENEKPVLVDGHQVLLVQFYDPRAA